MKCEIVDLGLVRYDFANYIQLGLAGEVKDNLRDGSLLFCEFFPVYTIGRNGSDNNFLVSLDFLKKKGIDCRKVDRGGDVTFHGPGQLIIYPIFNLAYLKKDIHWYLRKLETVIADVLSGYGIYAGRKNGLTGVWLDGKKIASIGVAVSRWVTYHGIALNVNNDLSYFDFIHPCGIKDCRMTSVAKLKGTHIDMNKLKRQFMEQFKNAFGFDAYADAKTAAMA
jgi:lipoyl(octanoyl) transferase